MEKFQSLLSLGFLFIFAGIFLLVISSISGLGASTFFFFPFFFVITSDSTVIFLLMALMFFIFALMMRSAIVYFNHAESRNGEELTRQDKQVGIKCSYCSRSLPADAVYCSSCGNPVDHDKTLDQ